MVPNPETGKLERKYLHPPLNENRLSSSWANAANYSTAHEARRAARLIPQDINIEIVEVCV
jgi:hypothetical protein